MKQQRSFSVVPPSPPNMRFATALVGAITVHRVSASTLTSRPRPVDQQVLYNPMIMTTMTTTATTTVFTTELHVVTMTRRMIREPGNMMKANKVENLGEAYIKVRSPAIDITAQI